MNHPRAHLRPRPPQHWRGLTLIEMLVALALLSGLMLAVVSWTQAVARSGAELAEPHAWRSAAERVIGLIHDDLQSGDWLAPPPPPPPPPADAEEKTRHRVLLEDGELTIRTQSGGEATHRYRFDALKMELSLAVHRMDGGSKPSLPTHRLLIQQVEDWTCSIEQTDEPPERRLSITMTGDDGTTVWGIFDLEDDA